MDNLVLSPVISIYSDESDFSDGNTPTTTRPFPEDQKKKVRGANSNSSLVQKIGRGANSNSSLVQKKGRGANSNSSLVQRKRIQYEIFNYTDIYL